MERPTDIAEVAEAVMAKTVNYRQFPNAAFRTKELTGEGGCRSHAIVGQKGYLAIAAPVS
jgi:hypothetical protein